MKNLTCPDMCPVEDRAKCKVEDIQRVCHMSLTFLVYCHVACMDAGRYSTSDVPYCSFEMSPQLIFSNNYNH